MVVGCKRSPSLGLHIVSGKVRIDASTRQYHDDTKNKYKSINTNINYRYKYFPRNVFFYDARLI